MSRRGYLQSKNEKVLWNKYKTAHLLGALRWEFIGIVCMKRYNPIAEIPHANVLIVKSRIKELNIDRCDLYNPKNWGIENNEYYLIDYGISQYISSLYR
tara:strand:- start:390 stop:686 length:297 start_codon:yes stop_codon:yes gene_type:complete